MKNLSEVSIHNRVLVWYFIILVAIAGIFSYMKLGRMEDPTYTVRTMVVSVAWPGATAEQMQEQVTDKIEKKLQDTPNLDYIKSYSRPGQSVIYVYLDDKAPRDSIRSTWHEVRNLTEDMKKDLPEGVYGPYYNDRFDDVYGSIYAITGDGYSYEELRQKAEKIRRMMMSVDDVSKVELVGEQSEKVYIEVANSKLAELGIAPTTIANAVKGQNQMTPAGMVDTQSDNVYLRLSGVFEDVEAIRNLPINANGRVFRLGDIATVERRYTEPADPKMFYNGKPTVGIALSMKSGGNNLQLGENLKKLQESVKSDLPAGMEIHQVSDQPQVVKESISDFTNTLREAIIIVLVVIIVVVMVAAAAMVMVVMIVMMVLMLIVVIILIVIVMMLVLVLVVIIIVVVMMAAAAHTVLVIVVMVVVMLFFVLVGVLFVGLCSHGDQLCLEVVLGGHGLQDLLTGQFVPCGGHDGSGGVLLAQHGDRSGDLLFAGGLGAAEQDAACVADLVIVELAEVLHIHLDLVHIGHGDKAVQLHIQMLGHAFHSAGHIGELAHAGGLDDDAVGVVLLHHLLQSGAEIAHQRAADAACVQLVDLNAAFLQETAVNADLAELVLDQHHLLACKGLGDQLFDQSSFAGAKEAGEDIDFSHVPNASFFLSQYSQLLAQRAAEC